MREAIIQVEKDQVKGDEIVAEVEDNTMPKLLQKTETHVRLDSLFFHSIKSAYIGIFPPIIISNLF